MELKNIVKNLAKYKVFMLISLVVGVLGGVLFFVSPKTYVAIGSFYVTRATDTTKFRYFAYEGYYAQQTGAAYTNNVISLFESPDIKFEALSKLNLPTDSPSLRRISRMIKVSKVGPQIVTLKVSGKNSELVSDLWNVVADSTIRKSSSINMNGDPMLDISRLSNTPTIRESFRPLWLCALSGALVAPLLVISFITLRSYFKWK